MQILWLALAMAGGVVVAVQSGANATLANWANGPLWAGLISFLVGTVLLVAALAVLRQPWPQPGKLAEAPWWAWTGGLCGAIYVACVTIAAPRLGAAALMSFVIAGQVLVALVLDQFGLVGFAQHSASWTRIAGMMLVAAGAALVRFT